MIKDTKASGHCTECGMPQDGRWFEIESTFYSPLFCKPCILAELSRRRAAVDAINRQDWPR